jgi:hypothetical protein
MFKKLFEPSPLQKWWDALPEVHKKYAESQPVWTDKDLYRSLMIGIIIGFVFGFIAGV